MPDEIELTPEDEAALDKAWEEIAREEKQAAAKQAQQEAAKNQRLIDKAREVARKR